MPTSDPSPAIPRDVTPTPPDSQVAGFEPGFAGASPKNLNEGLKQRSAPAVPAQEVLALPPVPPVSERNSAPRPAARPRQLWLGIHLPRLPLDVLCRRDASSQAGAVFEEREGIRRILLADRAAERRGVTVGMPVNAALALTPSLELLPRDPARETRVLQALAARAERFTPCVSLEMPDGLLLEIAGSLALFGDSEFLRRQVATVLSDLGFSAALAIAPTPLASTWLARGGRVTTVVHPEYLAGAFGPLPLECLRWPDAVCESLRGMGVTSIGECLRLPREGFARRFGALRLLQLDRALGRLPDPRASYRLPERFCRDCELDEEEDDRERLLEACRRLLGELEQFLLSRQVAVQQLEFSFFHLKTAVTRLALGGLEPRFSADHWHQLLAMKFDRLALPAGTITIRLESGSLQACGAVTGTLPFDRAPSRTPALSVTRLMERLAARLGDDGVHGLTAVAEHRPHYAWRPVRVTGQPILQCDLPGNGWPVRRPLWLLTEPLRLEVARGVPWYEGPLQLENGPERLETGWWDGHDIAHDYFTAVNPKGVRLWIYCHAPCSRRSQDDWYLHGIFA